MGVEPVTGRPRARAGSIKGRSRLVRRPSCSSVAQRQSIRLLTGGLLVRIQPEEPISSFSSIRQYVERLNVSRRKTSAIERRVRYKRFYETRLFSRIFRNLR